MKALKNFVPEESQHDVRIPKLHQSENSRIQWSALFAIWLIQSVGRLFVGFRSLGQRLMIRYQCEMSRIQVKEEYLRTQQSAQSLLINLRIFPFSGRKRSASISYWLFSSNLHPRCEWNGINTWSEIKAFFNSLYTISASVVQSSFWWQIRNKWPQYVVLPNKLQFIVCFRFWCILYTLNMHIELVHTFSVH